VNDKNKVLAATLDVRLAANGVDLDSVVPLEVMLSSRRRYYGRDRRGLSSSEEEEEGASVVPGGQLAVSMEVMGHYSPPPDIDFDYVVRDSINRDTDTIRRGLSEYNVHCREQTSKVLEQGLVRDDFDSVLSASGARPNGYYDGLPADTGGGAGGGSFSTACSSSILVPEYFETNLREIEARGVSEVRFVASTPSAAATSSGLEAWAQGPVAAITGLIVLLAGVLLFRRSLGPRPAAAGGGGKEGRDGKFRTKVVGGRVEKSRRFLFGEAGGDDESVDSAFYSDDDDDAAPKKTEKEGKASRKSRRAAISSSATSHPATSFVASARGSLRSTSVRVGGGGYSAPSSSGVKAKSTRDVRGKSSRDLRGKSKPSKDHPQDTSTKKLAVSQGTDDSNSADGRSDSSDEARRASAREGKRSTAKRAQSMRTVSSKPSVPRKAMSSSVCHDNSGVYS
jgi:hypothetical protein